MRHNFYASIKRNPLPLPDALPPPYRLPLPSHMPLPEGWEMRMDATVPFCIHDLHDLSQGDPAPSD